MASEERNARWAQLVSARQEFDRDSVVLPLLRSRIDGKVREPSPRSVHFAEALAVSASWARIDEARQRRYAA